MKTTGLALLLLTLTAAGCSWTEPVVGPLFKPKVDPHSSPETLMKTYKQAGEAAKPKKIWALYSEDLKAQKPNGLSLLENRLENQPVRQVKLGNPITLSKGHVLYYNVVGFQNGEYVLERIKLVQNDDGEWLIDNITWEQPAED